MENKNEFFEPKVGEIAYFWNKLEDGYCQAKLLDVTNRFYTTMGVFAFSSSEIPPIALQEVEEELPKKGQVCWGRRENKWQIGHFIRKSEEGKYEISANPEDERGIAFAEITTKNPYQTVEEYNQQGLEKHSHEFEKEASKMETTDREPRVGDMVFAWTLGNLSDLTHKTLDGFGKENGKSPYVVGSRVYKHCSLKNPLIK